MTNKRYVKRSIANMNYEMWIAFKQKDWSSFVEVEHRPGFLNSWGEVFWKFDLEHKKVHFVKCSSQVKDLKSTNNELKLSDISVGGCGGGRAGSTRERNKSTRLEWLQYYWEEQGTREYTRDWMQ